MKSAVVIPTRSARDEDRQWVRANSSSSAKDRKRKRSPSPCDCHTMLAPPKHYRQETSYNLEETIRKSSVDYIDSHCHLDLLFKRTNFRGDLDAFMKRKSQYFPENFGGCVAVFCYPSTWERLIYKDGIFASLMSDRKIWLAVGCHPKSAFDFDRRAEQNLRELLQDKRVRAVGEIGLDFSGKFYQHRRVQEEVLRKQVTIALQYKLPIVIHARDAEREICDILSEMVPRNYRMHRHCFTGDWKQAQQWMKLFPNSYIGLTPGVTYHSNSSVREVAKNIPLDRLLLETDAPYFLPSQVPKSEQVSNPGMAISVAAEVAHLKRIHIDDVLKQCLANTKKMYDI